MEGGKYCAVQVRIKVSSCPRIRPRTSSFTALSGFLMCSMRTGVPGMDPATLSHREPEENKHPNPVRIRHPRSPENSLFQATPRESIPKPSFLSYIMLNCVKIAGWHAPPCHARLIAAFISHRKKIISYPLIFHETPPMEESSHNQTFPRGVEPRGDGGPGFPRSPRG